MKKNILITAWISFMALPLFLSSCKKETTSPKPGLVEKTFSVANFTKIYVSETFHVVVKKGDEFKLVAKGLQSDIDQVRCTVDNNHILTITFSEYASNPVEVEITMPMLIQLYASGGASASVTGFQDQHTVLRAVFSGRSKGIITGTGVNTNVEVGGFSELTIIGSTENIYGQISADGKLNAYGLTSREVDLSLTERAQAWVLAQNVLFGSASDNSRLYYKGNPATTHFETYGNGLIIHE